MTNEITNKERFIIETTTALDNPRRDKRSRDWFAQDTIPPARFLCDGSSMHMIGTGRFSHILNADWREKEKALFDLIMQHGTRVEPDTMREHLLLLDARDEGDLLLGFLRKRGWITIKQIAEAKLDLDASWEADVCVRDVI